MKRYVLTPSAKRDVNEIWDCIANDSIEAGDRVLGRMPSFSRSSESSTLRVMCKISCDCRRMSREDAKNARTSSDRRNSGTGFPSRKI
jgi:plasmid stabilization system protein ParE